MRVEEGSMETQEGSINKTTIERTPWKAKVVGGKQRLWSLEGEKEGDKEGEIEPETHEIALGDLARELKKISAEIENTDSNEMEEETEE